jgi:hypothetical protein
MARIDLVEPYAIRLARQSIRDSLMSHGEECVLVHMWHVNEATPLRHPRCAVCFHDIYKSGDKYACPACYGTTWEGGVKDVYRAWAIFTDSDDAETFGKRGLWHPTASKVHTEHMPDLWQRDFVIRVARWSIDHRVLEVDGIYVFDNVQNESLRTGNNHGQTSFDNVSQIADLSRISDAMPIGKFPVVGVKFDRYDGKVR